MQPVCKVVADALKLWRALTQIESKKVPPPRKLARVAICFLFRKFTGNQLARLILCTSPHVAGKPQVDLEELLNFQAEVNTRAQNALQQRSHEERKLQDKTEKQVRPPNENPLFFRSILHS